MAPNLKRSQHVRVEQMIRAGAGYTNRDIALVAPCSRQSVWDMRRKLHRYGTTRAPPMRRGRRSDISGTMQETLLKWLSVRPHLYQAEMVRALDETFEDSVSIDSVRNLLRKKDFTKTVIHRIASERNADLRDHYLHQLACFDPKDLYFIDESGCDDREGFRRTGWSPRGIAPVQESSFQHDNRWHILPAYSLDGVALARIYQGSTTSAVFEDFIQQLLCHLEPGKVLIMDNASIHRSKRMRRMCREAGVFLLYLPPYSPDLNPIEMLFAGLKAFIKRDFGRYEACPEQGFGTFLWSCLDIVGQKKKSAEGYFRHAGIDI